jgi:hypothetical protein
VVKPHLALLGQLVLLLGLNQRNGMMICGVAEKGHAVLVFVGELESHDLCPELRAALDVTDTQHYVTDFFYFDRRFSFRHTTLLSA